MKKLFLLLLTTMLTIYGTSQVPQGINYQTVVRDNNGALITDQNVTFRFSVISGSAAGTIMYREVHNTATNALGLVNLIIGQGTPVTGTFSDIVWANAAHYLAVEIDPQGGNAFVEMGTSQLMSVPYALSAGNSSTSMAQLTDVNVSGVTEGQVLKWNGTEWLPANDVGGGTGDNWGTQTAQTGSALTGNGTAGSPLNIAQQGATNGQVLKWNGTAWLPASDTDTDTNTDSQTLTISGNTVSITGGNSITLPTPSGDNWGTQTVQANNAFAGNGTTASPLALAQQGATSGQVLKWNGTAWMPAADTDTNTDAQTLTITGNTVSITGGNSIALPTPAGDNWGTQTVQSNNAFSGSGTTASPLTLAQQGATSGQVLKWNGTAWVPASDINTDTQTLSISGNTVSIAGGNSITLPVNSGWGLAGNTGTIDNTHFIGTTDNIPLNIRVNNQKAGRIESNPNAGNTAYGYQSLNSNTNGIFNTANGYWALHSNTTGSGNTANGYEALYYNTEGSENTANGFEALYYNTGGNRNTANGFKTLIHNTTGNQNTANGHEALYYNTTGNHNTANGSEALFFNTVGANNTANGYAALKSNTTGNHNTANGSDALFFNTTGANNTANGYAALKSNTTGNYNTANGCEALSYSTTGSNNTANGFYALYSNTAGANNTANGYAALKSNTTGNYNTANGSEALYYSTAGGSNTANGYQALYSNTTGANNTATGLWALYANTTANNNTANGISALRSNTTGDYNTANGTAALYNNSTGSNNTAIGRYAGFGSSGVNFNNCTFVGYNSYPTVARTNVTMLGASIANGQSTGNNQVLLGSTAVTQLRAQVTGITAYSDARFKNNVRHDVKGLDFINRLQPVTYNERPEELHKIWGTPDSLLREIDHSEINNTRFIGFLAQDVAQAAKESGFDFPGIDEPRNEQEVYSLRYTDFIMPLVVGMKEQQQMIEEQQKEINELKKLVHALLEKEK